MKVKFNSQEMKGDILIIDENHRTAASRIVDLILSKIQKTRSKFVITVAGESGAGKSEIAESIADKLKENKIKSYIFGQDDYFKLPPKTNARHREKDISWVGMQEVNLDVLDQNILDALSGKPSITKPLVDFYADQIGEEKVMLAEFNVLIAEGTYTTTLKNIDCRIFIDRTKKDTLESRKKRAREKQDDFLEKILTIEHEIISKHKNQADIIISKDWNVTKQK
jgi:uridine kinase